MNRLLKRELNRQKLESRLAGKGRFIFRNATLGDLRLPKTSLDGKRTVAPNEEFEGDDYFMQLVPSMLRYVRPVEETPQGEKMEEAKLILEQPEIVTLKGPVEIIVDSSDPLADQKRVLLNEDPMIGVEIVSD